MINYKWIINALEYAPKEGTLENVVKSVAWRYAAEKEYEGEIIYQDIYGSQAVGEPNPDNYIPYNDLTEQEVISWLEATLPVDEYQVILAAQIENIINPKIVVDNNPFGQ